MARIFKLNHLTPSEALVSLLVILLGTLTVISLGIWMLVR